jgi:cell division protein FtsZ
MEKSSGSTYVERPAPNFDKPVEKDDRGPRIEWVLSPDPEPDPIPNKNIQAAGHQPSGNIQSPGNMKAPAAERNSPTSAASGGYLARPSNIYAEEPRNERQSNPEHNGSVKPPVMNTPASNLPREEEAAPDMQLVFKDNGAATDEPGAYQTHSLSVQNSPAEEPAMQDDTDDPKRRAAERINKLRNLSFNINAADPNNEFETVPAYIRRNLELYNTISNVENFYSSYEVKTDENNNTEISTINTFLDGKRPD